MPSCRLRLGGNYPPSRKRWEGISANPSSVRLVTFSPNGKVLASCGKDGTVHLWDVAKAKKVRVLKGHADLVRAVAFSPDGKYLASGCKDGSLKLWNAWSGEGEQRAVGGAAARHGLMRDVLRRVGLPRAVAGDRRVVFRARTDGVSAGVRGVLYGVIFRCTSDAYPKAAEFRNEFRPKSCRNFVEAIPRSQTPVRERCERHFVELITVSFSAWAV